MLIYKTKGKGEKQAEDRSIGDADVAGYTYIIIIQTTY